MITQALVQTFNTRGKHYHNYLSVMITQVLTQSFNTRGKQQWCFSSSIQTRTRWRPGATEVLVYLNNSVNAWNVYLVMVQLGSCYKILIMTTILWDSICMTQLVMLNDPFLRALVFNKRYFSIFFVSFLILPLLWKRPQHAN